MKFSKLAEYFNQIEEVGSRIEMTKLLSQLFEEASPEEAKVIAYFALGKLAPPYITLQFNFAKKSALKVIAQLLDVTEATVKNRLDSLGDLGSVLAQGEWQAEREDPTVLQIYKNLQNLCETGGAGSQDTKLKQVLDLVKHLAPDSGKYVIRILTGTLRLGFSDMTIIDALSWMLVGNKSERGALEHAYNVCADIGNIAYVAKKDGLEGIKAMHISIGIPIRPSAAERLPTAKDIVEKLGSCVVEPKLDGFRLQIHIDKTHKKPKIEFFSRNLTDMSQMFPDLVAAFEGIPVETMICEGEAIVFDPNTGNFVSFQETVKRKRKHGIDQIVSELPLQVYIFDLLYFNGESYLDKSLKTRRAELRKLFSGFKSDVIKLIEEVPIEEAKQLEDYFNDQIGDGLEGVVVKKPNSHYQPGKRNFNWIKLKRQETGSLEDTIDCVILGYYTGQGKRASFGVGAFLVGVYNKKKDIFETVAKIGTGMKDDEWIELKKKCEAIKVIDKPVQVECAKDLYPDVWVNPEIVCLVRADEITRSPIHAAGKSANELGLALRFPRFMGYRPDKSSNEATTVTELNRLFEDQKIKKK
ncbi:ATP-dependent DNA ligase [bacterium]|jgi:DNA ligase 1|nr:ATP-dependent DNA ligase [bacterium]MBT5014852.1 ATP-dependent DNA ligase [bacterium]